MEPVITRKCLSEEFEDMQYTEIKTTLQASIDELFCFNATSELKIGGDT